MVRCSLYVFIFLMISSSSVLGFMPLPHQRWLQQPQLCPSSSTIRKEKEATTTALRMAPPNPSSLKPAAIPLMDSGKALARSGELLIDLTTAMDLYGGSLSAAGAQIRNSGDCVAQAAASCRFKTGRELVCDEVREAATCLTEATGKLKSAIEEAKSDENEKLVKGIESMVGNLGMAGQTLESAGECLMKKRSLTEIGINMEACGKALDEFSGKIATLAPGKEDGAVSSQRMKYAAEKMMEAGRELQGVPKQKPQGKGWLKG